MTNIDDLLSLLVFLLSQNDDVPDEGYSSNVPDEGYSSNVPDEGYSSNVPDEGYSSNVPDEGYSSNVPDEGYSSNVPDEGYSSNVPDEGYSRNASCALSSISTFLFYMWQSTQCVVSSKLQLFANDSVFVNIFSS